jgi:uncharacterized protein (DUF427 family)
MRSDTSTITPTSALTRRRLPQPATGLQFEPSERHVRGTIGELTVVDSYAPVLIWEPGRPVPSYVFPRADVRTDLLVPGKAPQPKRHEQADQWYDLQLNGRVFKGLVYEYDVDGMSGHVGIDWFGRSAPGIEHWFEEDEEIFKHPRDPFKRVDALRSSRHVQVQLDGVTLADTTNPVLLFETGLPTRYYIPRADVDFSRLSETDSSTTCPYKGSARYWSAQIGLQTYSDMVWSYPTPLPAVAQIKDRLAFYNELVDTVVDDVTIERPTRPVRRS